MTYDLLFMLKNARVLITSGPTAVAVDEMRVITNRSSGEIGRLIANAFTAAGGRVTLLEGAVTTAIPLAKGISVRKFYLFEELSSTLRSMSGRRFDVIVHAAAVSDFAPVKKAKGKIPSGDQLRLDMVPTPKLVDGLRKRAPEALLIGFKLEPTVAAAVRESVRLFAEAGCDVVVANAFEKGKYRAAILSKDGEHSGIVDSREATVRQLIRQCSRLLAAKLS